MASSRTKPRSSHNSHRAITDSHDNEPGQDSGATTIERDIDIALHVIATPIGNLGDITVRALEVLRSASRIYCEDTRKTRKLLSRYNIHPKSPLRSVRAENERGSVQSIIDDLAAKRPVAYLTDAGTPAIGDPGALLAQMTREAGHRVIPIPGASAITALASVAGCRSGHWIAQGFLPGRPVRRRRRLEYLLQGDSPFYLFESPHRIAALLGELSLRAPNCRVIIGRELTKYYEEIIEGTPEKIIDHFAPKTIRGEFVLLVDNTEYAGDTALDNTNE